VVLNWYTFRRKEKKTMTIAEHKKRYQMTLTPARVHRFHELAKSLGVPPSAMSSAVDDFLKDIADVMQIWKDEGKIEVKSLRKLMGKQLELIEADERKVKNVGQKRNTVSRS
jgi:hypothetical protein